MADVVDAADLTDPAEIREALSFMVQAARRHGAAFADRDHARINDLLDSLQLAEMLGQ